MTVHNPSLTGDGVTDNLATLDATVANASAGDTIILPRGQFLVSGTWDISKPLRIVSESGHGGGGDLSARCTINGGAALNPVVKLSATGITVLHRIGTNGGTVGIEMSGAFSGLSRFTEVGITNATSTGLSITGSATSMIFDGLHISGGQRGIHCTVPGALNASGWRGVRISNTQLWAVELENPSQSSVNPVTFSDTTIEGNNGGGFYIRNGYHVFLDRVYFESNGKITGSTDVYLGSAKAALCTVHMFGCTLSSKGAAQTNTRMAWHNNKGRLYAQACSLAAATQVDMAGYITGSRFWAILQSPAPSLIGGVNGSADYWPESF